MAAGHYQAEVAVAHRSTTLVAGRRFAAWALLYAAIMTYSSLAIGPGGFYFAPLDPTEAWHRFLATPLVDNGSDQRPDWIANLLLTIPLGFLVTGALASARAAAWRLFGTILALLLSLGFVLAVKYAQLFFPPRTVTLNYIIAQSIGVCIGVALLHLGRAVAPASATRGEPAQFRLLLDVAVVALVAYALYPFDLVLSANDWHDRLASLPQSLLALPWSDRPAAMRLILIGATAASISPLGMRLALRRDHPGLARIAVIGTAWMIVLLLASMMILNAAPSLATLICRIAGIVAGAAALRWLMAQDIRRGRVAFARFVAPLVLAYLLLLSYVQGLFDPHWQTPAQALAVLDPRGLLPLWDYYFYPKAHAAEAIAAHVVMYAPVGLMIWLRYGESRRNAWLAGWSAGLLALLVELARALHADRQPDLNSIIIAALSAVFALRLAPVVWNLLCSLSATDRSPNLVPPQQQPPRAAVTALARAQRSAYEQIGGHRRDATAPAAIPVVVRASLAIGCAAGAVALTASYPLGPWYAAIAVAIWVALLWRWPGAWLVLLPAMLPAVDLSPWTGWLVTSEADIAVLATLAVLLLRDPPSSIDLWPKRAAGVVLMLASLTCLIGLLRGVLLPYDVPGGSDNPYLEPLGTVRLAKPFFEALTLLPFLLARHRAHGDTVERFGWGMLLGLVLVGIAAVTERAAFVGVFDVHSDYRVVATFSSMHIGGGHIGAYIALALPFLMICLSRPNAWAILALPVVALLGGYTLIVTFARTAYAAALGGVAAATACWAIANRRRGRRSSAMAGGVLLVLIAAVVTAGTLTPYMMSRLTQTAQDFDTREIGWAADLAMERQDLLSFILGMGTGTFPRVAAASPVASATPGDYLVTHDAGHSYLTLRSGPEFYFGQKVNVIAGTNYKVTLDARAASPGVALDVILCAKLLLYSADCSAAQFKPTDAGSWEHFTATLKSPAATGWLPPPVELSLATGSTSPLDVSHIALIGPDGRDVVTNGDFADGTARWLFTSDRHTVWRIKDLYLATWFDGGVLGLVVLVVFVATAVAEAGRAVIDGNRWAVPVVGGIVALLISGVFDNVFEAPRLALLYYLVLMLGLVVGIPRRTHLPAAVRPSSR